MNEDLYGSLLSGLDKMENAFERYSHALRGPYTGWARIQPLLDLQGEVNKAHTILVTYEAQKSKA